MSTSNHARAPLGTMVAATAAIALVTGLGFGFGAAAIAGSRAGASSAQVAGGMQGGAHTMTYDYTGSYSGTKTATGTTLSVEGGDVSATKADTNALLAEDGGTLSVGKATATKTGDSSNEDNTNFYGTNAVSLTVGKESSTVLDGTTLTSDANGANAIFATDSGSVLARDVTITTSKDNSRALDATYSGSIVAGGLKATTKGSHSATLATDRGGGSVSVDGATLSTAGSGSPLLYSTGDIQVHDVKGTATGAQIAGMEGTNTILIADSTLESTVTGKTASDPVANGVIIYQSTSGDAESSPGERATFQATGSTLKSAIQEGSMFYCTNTSADILLSGTTLDFDSSKAALLTAAGNDSNNWGSKGSNGADITLTGRGQTLKGDVHVDAISSVALYLMDASQWTGATTVESDSDSGTKSGTGLEVNVDGTSTWTVTRDTTVTTLNVAKGGKVVGSDGKTATIVADGQTVVQGDGSVTVTVTGKYTTSVDSGKAATASTDLIDRKDYDDKFGTSTTWSMK
ncbi:MAG: adhesin [Bifidobacterium sp.]|nr:adhesin [Bifidobacterium sp.]